jgi:hypothetical protein
MGNESDDASFTFGNADRVMRDLANDVDLFRAEIGLSLFHVGTGINLNLWKGDIVNWSLDAGPECKITASDGLYELNMPYPTRKISRTCWKPLDSQACPYSQAGALDLVHFPEADAAKCDKGYDMPNGCLAHGMKRHYGAIIAEPQGVRIKENSTGTWGFGRSPLTSVSLVADSIYDQVLLEIYTDVEMPVNCKVAAGRDESDFYEALSIVGEGPLWEARSRALPAERTRMPTELRIELLPSELAQIVESVFGAMMSLEVDECGTPWFSSGDRLTPLSAWRAIGTEQCCWNATGARLAAAWAASGSCVWVQRRSPDRWSARRISGSGSGRAPSPAHIGWAWRKRPDADRGRSTNQCSASQFQVAVGARVCCL